METTNLTHERRDDSLTLRLRLAPGAPLPAYCQVTIPNGSSHVAHIALAVDAHRDGFAVRYPADFPNAPPLEPGLYHVEWRSVGGRAVRLGSDVVTVPHELDAEWIPHQLTIHVDYHPSEELDVVSSYPYSAPHEIREQRAHVAAGEIPADVKAALEGMVATLRDKLKPSPVRLPHRVVEPRIRRTVMTVVVQDRARAAELPAARSYFLAGLRP